MKPIYVVVAKGVLVFASTSEKWARNVMVTLAHAKPKLAGQIVMGTAMSDTHLWDLEEAWGRFPIWVSDRWPKAKRRICTVFVYRSKMPVPLFDVLDWKQAEEATLALEKASFITSVGETSTDDPVHDRGPLGFALLKPT